MSNLDIAVKEVAPGRALELTDVGLFVLRHEDLHALADQLAEEELLEEMSSYRKRTTGVDNTIFISPKGNTRHTAGLKVAIDPPDSINPRSETATVAIYSGELIDGKMSPALLEQIRQFIDINRDTLLDYWEYKISTDDMEQRLKRIN
jgi:NAD(P)H-dependent FMN reductase